MNDDDPTVDLPVITVGEVTDVKYSNMELNVPDSVFDKIVAVGKEAATDSDYFKIGFLNMLEESLANDEGAE